MRRLGFLCFASLLAVGIHQAAAAEADDTRAWQGTWKLVSCTYNGEPQMADMQWLVNGNQYTIRLNRRPAEGPHWFKLDPKQKRIDVFHHDTPKGTYGGRLKGMYEIQGDSLKVCFDLKGQRYPTAFDAGRGSARVLYQFQRERRD
jgi:uncharacterized protein (TIGR03067 family)